MTPPAGESLLADVAATVRRVFVACYQEAETMRTGVPSRWGDRPVARWDGGEDGRGFRYAASVWDKVAQLCLARQFDPVGYVHAQFAARAAGGTLPFPNTLTGAGAIAAYEATRAGAAGRLRLVLAAQDQIFRTRTMIVAHERRLDAGRAARRVMLDTTNGLSGLYRYCQSVAARDEELAARFLDAAVSQYVFQRAEYDAAWGGLIPPQLRSAAASVFGATARRGAGDGA